MDATYEQLIKEVPNYEESIEYILREKRIGRKLKKNLLTSNFESYQKDLKKKQIVDTNFTSKVLEQKGINPNEYINQQKSYATQAQKNVKNPRDTKKEFESGLTKLQSNFKQIIEATSGIILITMINTYTLQFLSQLFGSSLQIPIVAIIVAPIVEEIGKYWAQKKNMPHKYNVLFNVFEAGSYILNGVNPLYRIFPIILHTINTIIHQKQRKKETTSNKKGIAKQQLIVTIIIHSIYNLIVYLL